MYHTKSKLVCQSVKDATLPPQPPLSDFECHGTGARRISYGRTAPGNTNERCLNTDYYVQCCTAGARTGWKTHFSDYVQSHASDREVADMARMLALLGFFWATERHHLLCTKKLTGKPICSWSLTRSYNAPTKTKTVNKDAESSSKPIWRGFETDYYVQYFLRRHCHFCLTKLALQLAKNVWEVSRLCTSIGNRV